MKALFLFFVTLPAFAGVTPIFKQDGSQATFLFAGMPGDPDATGMWNALKVAPEDFQGKLAKKQPLVAPGGARVGDIDCVFSKMIMNNGTCTVILRATPGMVEISGGHARLWLTGAGAAAFADAFSMRDESTILYRSANGRFNVTVARDRGVVTDFVVDWK